jgi:uncharacterized protein (TIGR03083 family)
VADPGVPVPAPDHLEHLGRDAARVVEVTRAGPLDAPVAGCPDWDLRDLVAHLGTVHQWARTAAATGAEPAGSDWFVAPPDAGAPSGDLADWYDASARSLIDTLAGLDPEAPTWHVFPAERTVGVWVRRQAQETSLHRWDAEHAVGDPRPIDPAVAADGIDEYFGMMLARRASRDGLSLPSRSLHVHCTDTAGEWTVRRTPGGELECTREHQKGDAALRGRAEDLLLALWGRPVPDGAVDVVGDAGAAADWLALGGV